MENKRKVLIISIISSLIILIGSSYAFFMYSKTSSAFNLTSGDIDAQFVNGDNKINLAYAYPISDDFAKTNLAKLGYLDFSINGNINEENQAITYEIYLEEDSKNTLDSNYIKVYLTDDTNKEITNPEIYNYLDDTTYPNSKNGKVIYQTSKSGEFNDKYRIYVWIDSSYTQNVVNQSFSFKVNLYAYNDDAPKSMYETLKEMIESHTTESCNPIKIDNNDTLEDESDDTIYFSGTNDCVNFNYVWYSGKLWRIVAINPDGTIKMITQDIITAINYGPTNNYSESVIRVWLNEDFLDTLYNHDKIVQTANWNATLDNNDIPTRPKTGADSVIVNDSVGLLNAYEFMNISNGNIDNYLNIKYDWLLITPYSNTNIWEVDADEFLKNTVKITNAFGIRPTINLKSDVLFLKGGDGSITNPYKISNDKKIGKVGEKVNNRVSGEYVSVDNKIYRIVGIENGNTKLTSYDYADNGAWKYFGSTINWGDSVSSKNPDYWGYYLNNTNNGTFEGTWLTKELMKYIGSSPS